MAPVRSVFVAAACAVATAFTPLGTARVPLASPMHMSAPATGTGPSLQFQEGTDPSFKGGRLGDKLKEADTQRRKDREAAEARERAAELAREERKRKIDFMYEMDENTPAGTVNDYMYKGGVTEILEQLDHDLVGLIPVKKRVREIAALLVLDKMRRKLGRHVGAVAAHVLHGRARHSETTVAVRMGQIRRAWATAARATSSSRRRRPRRPVRRPHRAQGEEVIKRAMGGVLLVDEAYYLYNAANDRDYGQESIEILLNVMENNKEDLIVVLAGYKDRMDTFFSFIPGMSSRIGNHIDFPNYEINELTDIAAVMGRDLEYDLDQPALDMFQKYITRRMELPFFSNARTVRNAMDRARMNSAIRIFNSKMDPSSNGLVNKEELMKITDADFGILYAEAMAAPDDAIMA